jgi:hypothetical protein
MKLQILMLNLKFARMNVKKIKFDRDAYTIGRHPSIKDRLGFQRGTKNLTSQRASNLIKEKGKAPLASSSHSFHDKKNHAYLYAHVKNASNVAHHDGCYDHVVLPVRDDVSLILMPCLYLLALHMFKVRVDLGAMSSMLFLMRLEMYLMAQLFFIILMMPHMC